MKVIDEKNIQLRTKTYTTIQKFKDRSLMLTKATII